MSRRMAMDSNLPGIAQVLIMDQLLTNEEAINAQTQAQQENINFVDYLVEKKILPAIEIARVGARNFGVPLLDLDQFEKENISIGLIDKELIKKHHVLPLVKRGDHLFIAVNDPSMQLMLNEIKFQTGLYTHSIVVETDKLSRYINELLDNENQFNDFMTDSTLDDLEFTTEDGEDDSPKQDTQFTQGADDAPVVRFVHKVLLDAVNHGASDIHFEPYEKSYRVRFRVDGILYEMAHPPVNMAHRIAARLKVMSNLDISERRLPQDGRFKIKISKKNAIDFRISTCPTVNGEKIVMRILDSNVGNLSIENLGFNDEQRKAFEKGIQQPQGMILVTGPTGSGKTVTLYTALEILNTEEKNISTAEDPVEMKMPGINQVHINLKTGLTFSSALRSFLRQDPDIIMVGEMRDLETAEIGIKAAQTGHLVLSTLHTNSGSETLTRLVNMGIPAFNIASTVSLIIAQRLARKLCDHCKVPDDCSPEMLDKLGLSLKQGQTIYKAVGCEQCANGYRGRLGLFEVMPMNNNIADIILKGGNARDIGLQAEKDGITSIRKSGIAKVAQGLTSIEELNRVTKD